MSSILPFVALFPSFLTLERDIHILGSSITINMLGLMRPYRRTLFSHTLSYYCTESFITDTPNCTSDTVLLYTTESLIVITIRTLGDGVSGGLFAGIESCCNESVGTTNSSCPVPMSVSEVTDDVSISGAVTMIYGRSTNCGIFTVS